ncbi:hypothetical protein CP99DC5_1155B, partial [Chlamydia psittaci 99DC5]
RRTNPIKNL